MKDSMHIGNRIKTVLESMPRQYTISWFAKQIHCDRRNVYYIFDRSTIDTGMLARISQILGHNFFRDLADSFSPYSQEYVQDSGEQPKVKNQDSSVN